MQLTVPSPDQPWSGDEPWHDPAAYWSRIDAATRHLDAPVGAIDLGALTRNAHDLLRRANGVPIRVASKSIRVRPVLDAVLATPGFAGVLAYTLPEALWLAGDTDARPGVTDVVVGYPTTHRSGIRRLATSPELAARVTLMVDDVADLVLIDSVVPPAERETIRIALELDAGYDSKALGFIGARRSPLHTPEQLRAMAEVVASRPGFALVGVMAYESQIAGTIDDPAGRPAYARVVRWMQQQSRAELAARRAEAIASVREVADLEFVNGGGTGSLESTSRESAVTDIAAGSGLFGPHLFDHYQAFSPAPAAGFGLDVVRRPTPSIATVLGGGWIASGPTGPDRQPLPVHPGGLSLLSREMAGEVQTPLTGDAAASLAIGDRVWFRHTKAGEISEHLEAFAVVDGDAVVDEVPTYRGEGKVFL